MRALTDMRPRRFGESWSLSVMASGPFSLLSRCFLKFSGFTVNVGVWAWACWLGCDVRTWACYRCVWQDVVVVFVCAGRVSKGIRASRVILLWLGLTCMGCGPSACVGQQPSECLRPGLEQWVTVTLFPPQPFSRITWPRFGWTASRCSWRSGTLRASASPLCGMRN